MCLEQGESIPRLISFLEFKTFSRVFKCDSSQFGDLFLLAQTPPTAKQQKSDNIDDIKMLSLTLVDTEKLNHSILLLELQEFFLI